MGEPTLMFGIGAAKAGTTWLYRHLAEHPQCSMRALKELHYFDALENGSGEHYRRSATAKLGALNERLHKVKLPAQIAALKRMIVDTKDWLVAFDGVTRDDAAYLDYVNAHGSSARLVGEITPAYGLLGVGMLAEMARLAPVVRFVYLLRDPVDRLWSHVRMLAARVAKTEAALAEHAGRILKSFLDGGEADITLRSDYRGAMDSMLAAIPRPQLHFEFFEEMFSEVGIRRLSGFLGISPVLADTGRAVYASPKLALNETQRRAAGRALAPQYEYVNRFFDGNVPARWRQNWVEA